MSKKSGLGIKAAFLVFLVLWLPLIDGCGLRLRGAIDLPEAMARTHIAGIGQNQPLTAYLTRQLEAVGARVVPADQAGAVLRVTREQRGQRVLSVGVDGGVREFELYYTVSFEVEGKNNDYSLPDRAITLTRSLVFEENQVLATGEERELLYEEMQQEMARLMLSRLRVASEGEA